MSDGSITCEEYQKIITSNPQNLSDVEIDLAQKHLEDCGQCQQKKIDDGTAGLSEEFEERLVGILIKK